MYLGKGRAADYNRDAKGEDYVPPPQSGDPIDRTLPHGVEISAKGLILPQTLDAEQWREIGTKLGCIYAGMQWAIGDWWAYGHSKYGERKATAIAKKLPYEFGSLMNMGRVARRVTSSFRNEALTYSHHVAVAGLDPEYQKKYLDRALKRNWSVNALKRALAAQHERAGMDDMRGENDGSAGGSESLLLRAGHNSSFGYPDSQFDWVSDLIRRSRQAMRVSFQAEALDHADDATIALHLVALLASALSLWQSAKLGHGFLDLSPQRGNLCIEPSALLVRFLRRHDLPP